MNIQNLVSLPPGMAREFATLERRTTPEWFAGNDPKECPLGSGGGTVHLLVQAWRDSGAGAPFDAWLRERHRVVLHAGGQSRRLPSYAATGKALAPVPVFRWSRGQRVDQSLLDVQLPRFQQVLRHGGADYRILIASGDVLLLFDQHLPQFPSVDILGLGMWATPEQAQHFGTFFCRRSEPDQLAFVLQKPPASRIRELSADHLFLIDTGMWLLSAKAVEQLLLRCGWNADAGGFRQGTPEPFDLYGQLGPSLGSQPTTPDAFFQNLTSAVVALPRGEFHHFGTSRQMIEALSSLQTRVVDPSRTGAPHFPPYPNQHVQNSFIAPRIDREKNSHLWIENCCIPASWELAREHVLTGVPENSWNVRLEPGVCLDFVPIGSGSFALRPYGIDDRFDGRVGSETTVWLGKPIAEWFSRRGIGLAEAGILVDADIQRAPLFPCLEAASIDGGFLTWMFAGDPSTSADYRERWLNSRRLSARELQSEVRLDRLYSQRDKFRTASLLSMLEHRDRSVLHRLDLDHAARLFASTSHPLPEIQDSPNDLDRVHGAMFRAAILRHRGARNRDEEERQAFEILRNAIVRETQLAPARPQARIVEDQIVWARSPVRFDLAGGWTDTPPYCLENGGQVINAAIDLNGQPPMQVFVRLSDRPEIVLRSIDLGVEERISSYAELDTFSSPGSSFALAKAACSLAGFLPRFHAQGGHGSLKKDLEAFGAGLELSLLSAVPKGSGLGTSSILAATVLGALSQACGLGWDKTTLFTRTLALEQLMTTGGGWQDQAGAIFPGLKLIETAPGLSQSPRVRWLPGSLFGPANANRRMLLYYTGITRLAKSILAEIVRGMFLNSSEHLATLELISASTRTTMLAIEQCDYEALGEAVDLTWRLKQRLDSGTNPPATAAILDAIQDDLLAAQLPGAGGGGYLFLLARSEEAADRIRKRLTAYPPNPRARFVDFTISDVGLQVTRS
jgi:galactokinase/mevalonate kinase-like predicted kinase